MKAIIFKTPFKELPTQICKNWQEIKILNLLRKQCSLIIVSMTQHIKFRTHTYFQIKIIQVTSWDILIPSLTLFVFFVAILFLLWWDKRESSSRKILRSHEGGFNKPFEHKNTCNYESVETTKISKTTKPSNLIYTFLSPLALRKFQLRQLRQGIGSQQAWITREKWWTYKREVADNLYKILKEAPQVWLVKDNPPNQGTLSLTHTGYPQ